jgi:diketogulonate reductase-like aldo/keto reductase
MLQYRNAWPQELRFGSFGRVRLERFAISQRAESMKTVTLPSGERVPAFGMGTWYMGDDHGAQAEEIATLQLGLDLGARLIDTAEMYGDGRAESLVGKAIAARRDQVFLVSKVLPSNASRKGTAAACERSLRRLETDRIDLYLVHWRGNVPFFETMEAFQQLQQAGKIRHYGVSNLDLEEMKKLWSVPAGQAVQTDQLLYNLCRRGIEWDLLPWLRKHRIPVMAYSPIEQARLLNHAGLKEFARRHNLSPAQVALAWLLANDDIIVIPKTRSSDRLKENLGALAHPLTQTQRAELDLLFPPPSGPHSLEML